MRTTNPPPPDVEPTGLYPSWKTQGGFSQLFADSQGDRPETSDQPQGATAAPSIDDDEGGGRAGDHPGISTWGWPKVNL
jgi:hypothetical protein